MTALALHNEYVFDDPNYPALADRAPITVDNYADEREAAEEMALNSLAPNTLRAYASDWRAFEAWCVERGYDSLPASPSTLARYIPFVAKTLRCASISRRLAAIVYRHARYRPDLASPVAHPVVKDVWAGVRRKYGIAQHGKAALTTELLCEVVAPLRVDRRLDVRDRALLLLCFSAALRRSELVALNVGDVERVDRGLRIYIASSKTDQEGEGCFLGVPFGRDERTCPVRAWENWRATLINAAPDDPAFVTLYQEGQGVTRLRPCAVAVMVKRRIADANKIREKDKLAAIDGDFSGHSMRVGFITSAAANRVDALRISNQTRHKSLDMIKRYTRPTTIFDDNAAYEVGL